MFKKKKQNQSKKKKVNLWVHTEMEKTSLKYKGWKCAQLPAISQGHE